MEGTDRFGRNIEPGNCLGNRRSGQRSRTTFLVRSAANPALLSYRIARIYENQTPSSGFPSRRSRVRDPSSAWRKCREPPRQVRGDRRRHDARAIRDLPQPRGGQARKSVRERLLDELDQAIANTDSLPAAERQKLYGQLRAKQGLKRYLRTTKAGRLRIDRTAIRADAHLDGKFLLRSSDPTLSAEDIALGYKQLLQIERAWRGMKTTLDLRRTPVRRTKPGR